MDLTVVENLIKLMKGHEVSDLSYQDADIKIRVRFGGVAAAAPMVAMAPVRVAEPSGSAGPHPGAPVQGHEIKSPMVGTFYRSPKPDAPPFASVGDRVRKGQVLCIIEAMKLMNEIECDVDGVLTDAFPENASAVQFGQPLFRIVTG